MSLSDDVAGHGMGTELEVKDWRPIALSDLLELQVYYPVLAGELQIIWHSPRPFSSACIVETSTDSYLVKRSHASFRSVQDLEQEHHFIAHLAEQGLQVPKIYTHIQQGTALQINDWVYEVHQKIDGVDVYADQQSWKSFFHAEHAFSAGQQLAKLHLAAKSYPYKQPRHTPYLIANQNIIEQQDIVSALSLRIEKSKILADFFAIHPLSHVFLQQLTHFHHSLYTELMQVPKIWTHNDLHASNFIWSESGVKAQVAGIIDFGLSDLTTAAYDLATAVERNFIDWLALSESDMLGIDDAGLHALLRGYKIQGGGQYQLNILPKILPLVHIDFALYELEYFLGITKNQTHAEAAHAYLLDHLRWFTTSQGQVFLIRLRELVGELNDAE